MTGDWAELLSKNYTRLPHLITRVWWKQISSIEKDLVIAIWDATAGWGKPDAALTIGDLMEATGLSKPTVVKGLWLMRERRICERMQQQVAQRGHTYRYRLVPRAELRAVKALPPPARQGRLPLNVQQFPGAVNQSVENAPTESTPFTPSRSTPFTPSWSVLRSIKERSKDKEKHTHAHQSPEPVEKSWEGQPKRAAAPRVRSQPKTKVSRPHKSRHHKSIIRLFAEAQHGYTHRWNRAYPDHKIEGIRNPGGWTTEAARSGEHDDEIDSWLRDPSIYGSIASGY